MKNEGIVLTKNLSVMLQAGLNLDEALAISESQASGYWKKIIQKVKQDIEAGQSLAKVLEKYPRYFSLLYCNMIRLGETAGTLAANLGQLSYQLEKDKELRRKIWTASLYPLVVLGAIGVVGLFLSLIVIPKLTQLFSSLDIELPLTTRILFGTARFLEQWGIVVLVVLIVLVVLVVWLRKTKFFQKILLACPLIGRMVKKVTLTRFNLALSALLKSGSPIVESLEATAEAIGNEVYHQAMRRVLKRVAKGEELNKALTKEEKLFPKMISRMIAVGEHSGRLDEILLYLARFYEGEVDEETRRLTVILEPILLVIVGLIIAFIGLSIITPIYQITGSLGR